MKRYDKYKESGIPWIGTIPKHWEVQRLGRCFGENRSLNSDLECTEAYKFNYGSLIRKDENINPQELVDTYTKYTLLRENDIIINGLNLNYDFVTQRVAIATQKGIITSAYLTLSPRRGINHNYYCLLFKAMDSMKLFHGMGSGIRLTLSYKDLKNQCLPLPPLYEQEAIVAYLEEKVAQMDSLAAKQEAQIAYLRELKQAIIARAVTQGLDPHAPLRPSGIPWIGAIPKHWKVQRLGRCFGENRALNSDLECTEAYKFNYGSLIRKDENLNPQELVDTYMKYTLLRENDIVINGLNLNYDFVSQRVAIATQKGIITSAYLILSPRKGINHNYYCLLFKAMDSMRLFHGMGSGIRLTLSYKDLKNQWLPFPPPSEQEAIVTHINRKTEEIDRLIAMTEQEIARVRELKQTLIADVVTGRINVQPT